MAKAQIEDILVEDERRSDESQATMPTSFAGLFRRRVRQRGQKRYCHYRAMFGNHVHYELPGSAEHRRRKTRRH